MKCFIEYVAKLLVCKPDEVEVNVIETQKSIIYELTVDKSDYGMIVGKNGANISSLRALVFAINAKQGGKRICLDILER